MNDWRRRCGLLLLVGLALAGVAGLWLVPPIPQPEWYHDFADRRTLAGIPNFWNVASNLPLGIVGAAGVWMLLSGRLETGPAERRMFLVFFLAVALAAAGSACYHLDPANPRLVWDRLPIGVGFMALFAIVVAERVNPRAGNLMFVPLVLLGAATVLYWYFTETAGRGDLRPYFLAQLYPALAIPILLAVRPACDGRGGGKLYQAILWYGAAKAFEFGDAAVFELGGIVSGHTLKHLAVAASAFLVLSWARAREGRPLSPAAESGLRDASG